MSAKSFSDTPKESGQVPKAYNPSDVEDKWYMRKCYTKLRRNKFFTAVKLSLYLYPKGNICTQKETNKLWL